MDFDARKFLEIDLSDLEGEYANQAKKFEKISRALSDCNRLLERKDQELSIKSAERALYFRNEAKNGIISKLTEKYLEELLLADDGLRELKYEKIDLRHKRDILHGLVKSLDHRRAMLQSIGYSIRNELPISDFKKAM